MRQFAVRCAEHHAQSDARTEHVSVTCTVDKSDSCTIAVADGCPTQRSLRAGRRTAIIPFGCTYSTAPRCSWPCNTTSAIETVGDEQLFVRVANIFESMSNRNYYALHLDVVNDEIRSKAITVL